jgi:hypothetical protein
MFVTNHVLSGALVGHALRRRPVAAFVVGVASHLALDAVPHWGCEIWRSGGEEKYLKVARRDGVLGLTAMTAAALTAPKAARLAMVAGMAGAVLLDLDKPMLHFFGRNPFPDPVQRLHRWMQNESPEGLPNEIRFGLGFATANVVLSRMASGRRTTSAITYPNSAMLLELNEA